MRRLVLLEEFPEGFKADPGDRVISLTPRASYWLDKHGVHYQIPTEFGTELELERREDAYWTEELDWFDEIGRMLEKGIPELKARRINPTIIYGYQLKTYIDNLFIRGRESLTLLGEGYDEVVLWTAKTSHGPSLDRFDLQMSQGGVYARLWKHICATRGISYEERLAKYSKTHTVGNPLIRLRDMAREKTAQVLGFCREWQWFMFGRIRKTRILKRPLTFLLLETNLDLSWFLSRALRDGHRCLAYRNGRIIDVARVRRCLMSIDEKVLRDEKQAARWESVVDDLFSPTSQIWKWPDSWLGCSMAPVLINWLKSWVLLELPKLLFVSDQFNELYNKEGVDFVLTPGLMHRHHIAAVAATPKSRKTESVLVAHGDGPDDAKAWNIFNLLPFHHNFVPSEEFASYFREQTVQHNLATANVHIGSYRWQRYAELAQRPSTFLQRWAGRFRQGANRPPLDIPGDRPVVVYVIARGEVDLRYMNKRDYPDAWYYHFQSDLIRLFAKMPDYSFVIKLFPQQHKVRTAIEMLIDEMGSNHLYVSRAPFTCWLPWADRVILDIPSTTLYEVSRAGVPFHLLVHRGLPMRTAALDEFRDSLSFFREPEEAVSAVTKFLRGQAVRRPKVPYEGSDIVTTLCSLANRKGVDTHVALRRC